MFTYLNPEIRERLIEEGKLVRIDAQGQRLDPRSQPPADTLALNILGPIPMPMGIGDHPTTVDWYAAVRSTELGEVESLAGTLRESRRAAGLVLSVDVDRDRAAERVDRRDRRPRALRLPASASPGA